MNKTIRIENESVYRLYETTGQGTLEFGDLTVGISIQPVKSTDFILRVGPDGSASPTLEIAPADCQYLDVKADDSKSAVLNYVHCESGLRIKVHTKVEGVHLLKSLSIENSSDNPWTLFDVVLENVHVPDTICLSGGGRGWPVFVKGVGFTAIEFPESEGIISGSEYSLEYYPAVTLHPGDTYQTEQAVFVLSQDPEEAFRAYVDNLRLRTSKSLFACYCSWGAHEWEGPNADVANEQLHHLVHLKTEWRIPFEYYILDYGYWDDNAHPQDTGRYAEVDCKNRFPGNSFGEFAEKLQAAGLKLGMWFGIGCPARSEFIQSLKTSLLELISKYNLKLIKADFVNWNCENESHGHLPGKYVRYRAARNMMDVFAAAKAADSSVVIYATCFTRSPWWLRFVDFIVVGKEDVSDVPAPSYRDNLIHHTDLDHRFFELDAGTYIGYADFNYWSGKQFWRKSLIMSLSRSNQLFLCGDLGVLDEDDKLFLERVVQLWRIYNTCFGSQKRILGDPTAGEVYGWSNVANGRGLVAIFNPSWETKSFTVKATDLGCDPAVRNVCLQLFPDTEVAAIPADGGHFHAHIDPWEVLWLEVGPSQQHCELLEVKHRLHKNRPMHVTRVPIPDHLLDRIALHLRQDYFDTGSTFVSKTLIPHGWSGLPLIVNLPDCKGELYINNQPVTTSGHASFVVLYPGTPQYGLVKFGNENLFYVAVDEREIVQSQKQLIICPLSYVSGSACREDWPHSTDATMVVIVKYLKDSQPFRHSMEPRLSQCAVWLDGIWMEPYRVPPLVPRVWSGISWAVFMLDLDSDWECVRILIPELVDCDYDVTFFLTDQITARACCP